MLSFIEIIFSDVSTNKFNTAASQSEAMLENSRQLAPVSIKKFASKTNLISIPGDYSAPIPDHYLAYPCLPTNAMP